jgi:hypothetical protein
MKRMLGVDTWVWDQLATDRLAFLRSVQGE